MILALLVRGLVVLRRNWRPDAETTAAFLALMVRRASTLRAQVRVGWAILACEVVVFVPWLAHVVPNTGLELATAYGFLAGCVGIGSAVLVALGRRARRELAHWRAAAAEWSAEGPERH